MTSQKWYKYSKIPFMKVSETHVFPSMKADLSERDHQV